MMQHLLSASPLVLLASPLDIENLFQVLIIRPSSALLKKDVRLCGLFAFQELLQYRSDFLYNLFWGFADDLENFLAKIPHGFCVTGFRGPLPDFFAGILRSGRLVTYFLYAR